jgi:UDP-N-acetylmuramoylalanine--D-glutamate ligase
VSDSAFTGKKIAVIGAARTGMALVPTLTGLGAHVILTDSQSADALGSRASEAEGLGVPTRFGASPEEMLAGVDLVVPSPGVRVDAPVLRLAVRSGIPVMSEIEVAYRVAKAPILAVTGTNGKTTTTMLLGAMARAAGRPTFVCGNIAADDIQMPLITAAAQAGQDGILVAEISSFQLEWVEQFRPAVGVLTNISRDHQDRHASMAEYSQLKARLFAAQSSEDVAVLNAVSAPARTIGENVPSQKLWFDRGHCMKRSSACILSGRITVRWNGVEHDLGPVERIQLAGDHNVENVLAAAAAAVAFGLPDEAIIEAIGTVDRVPHRMEPVAEIDGIKYINNSMCTNVDAAVRSLEALKTPSVLIMGGQDKNSEFAPLATTVARLAKHVVLIGQAASVIEEALHSAGFRDISHADSMETALDSAVARAEVGDTVMLSPACASFGMFADFQQRGQAFRNAVNSLNSRRSNP